jgi:predicted DNA-binding transcriptional regulator AlpA
MTERLWTIENVAQFLGYKTNAVYQLVYYRRIPAIKISKKAVRFDPAEIKKWLAEKSQATEFSRSWNEFEADFAKTPEAKKKYADRANSAEEKLKELERKEMEKEQKAEQFEKQFEKAIENFEKEKGGK